VADRRPYLLPPQDGRAGKLGKTGGTQRVGPIPQLGAHRVTLANVLYLAEAVTRVLAATALPIGLGQRGAQDTG
jgi:hypothetical protein